MYFGHIHLLVSCFVSTPSFYWSLSTLLTCNYMNMYLNNIWIVCMRRNIEIYCLNGGHSHSDEVDLKRTQFQSPK